ncbi:MAG: BrnT family toxin [Deltaproteobacteria bacterium]|nr:BrnT family toxin [Deltaproteobacteria bacterium]
MRFDWDPKKAARNEKLHGVTFEEAKELFTDSEDVLEIYDVEHSEAEDRFKSIGPIRRGLVLVVWTERSDDVIRIISAWWATKNEEKVYREFLEERHGK